MPAAAPPLAKAPDTIVRKIMVGCILASILAAMDLIAAVRGFVAGQVASGVTSGIEAALVSALAYGLYRNSRVAAILLLAYYVLVRVVFLVTGNLTGLGTGVLIVLAFLSAARATFQYNGWLQQERRFPSSQRPRLSDDPFFRTPAPAATAQPAAEQAARPSPTP
ncbi:hypothetical protein [Xanthomonas sp. SS]|uniref:hypothetical protein n=1 Tax=Xanthomonas sp. SS TaxID=2724122 RepID=UPI00163A9C68|nr:hypothetical protein [Xanthomonas sp. SS]